MPGNVTEMPRPAPTMVLAAPVAAWRDLLWSVRPGEDVALLDEDGSICAVVQGPPHEERRR